MWKTLEFLSQQNPIMCLNNDSFNPFLFTSPYLIVVVRALRFESIRHASESLADDSISVSIGLTTICAHWSNDMCVHVDVEIEKLSFEM